MTTEFFPVEGRFYEEDIITLREWRSEWDVCPIQRDHKRRARKKEKQLQFRRLHPDHLEVNGVKLRCDCVDPVTGKQYKAGHKFKTNGHTRDRVWEMGVCEDGQPEQLRCKWRWVDSIDAVRREYQIFDSPTDVEKASDKLYGAYRNAFADKGKFITRPELYSVGPLNFACAGCFPNEFIRGKTATSDSLLLGAMKFEDALFWLQDVFNDKKFGMRRNRLKHQISMTCSYLMSYMKWKDNEDALRMLEDFIIRVSNNATDNDCDVPDTCTHFMEEYMDPQNSKYLNHGAVLEGSVGSQQMEGYNLLMIDSYIEGKVYRAMPNNWRKYYTRWTDEFEENSQQIKIPNFAIS